MCRSRTIHPPEHFRVGLQARQVDVRALSYLNHCFVLSFGLMRGGIGQQELLVKVRHGRRGGNGRVVFQFTSPLFFSLKLLIGANSEQVVGGLGREQGGLGEGLRGTQLGVVHSDGFLQGCFLNARVHTHPVAKLHPIGS